MSANHEAAKKEKLTEKFLLSLVSSITTTICSHSYHLLLLLLFITSSLKLSHLPTYQHHSYLELAISLEVETIYSTCQYHLLWNTLFQIFRAQTIK